MQRVVVHRGEMEIKMHLFVFQRDIRESVGNTFIDLAKVLCV